MIQSIDLNGLQSESRNSHSTNIDKVSTLELCNIINQEDASIAGTVQQCLPVIANAIDALESRVRRGGRVIYVGAGTSGRLGVLDASELPPTYSADPNQFVALIAGGEAAIRHAQEGAEDDVHQAIRDLQAVNIDGAKDSLVGIAASGRTPYVLSCMSYAKSLGCITVGVACSSPSAISASKTCDYVIEAVTGGEVVTGSTRMKAGTATKMILNMLSTGVMIKLGKTFGNMMVDLKATNLKLKQRARNILRELCGHMCPQDDDQIDELLESCHGSVKLAIATLMLQVPVSQATEALEAADGVLTVALDRAKTHDVMERSSANGVAQPEFVLFVDGGGSKTAAALVGSDGKMHIGEAGGSNATEIGSKAAGDAIMTAVERATAGFAELHGKDIRDVNFSSIWIGLAGYDRPKVAQEMNAALERFFNVTVGKTLKVSNDLELVASVAAKRAGTKAATVVVAGTGSIAMSFSKGLTGFQRVRRVGGYGHLLGDEGSAFDIGRQGIKHALEEIDQIQQSEESGLPKSNPSLLTRMLTDHFGIDLVDGNALLSAALSSNSSSTPKSEAKWKIADSARVVLEASRSCEVARSIITTAISSLATLAVKAATSQIDVSDGVLVLTGGLMRNEAFRELLVARVSEAGLRFKAVEFVSQPAVVGAKFMHELIATTDQEA